MKSFIYRISYLLFLLFLVPSYCFSQSAGSIDPNLPACAFDELNQQESQSDPAFREELEKYLQETVPALSGQNRSSLEPLLTIPTVVHIIHNGEPVGQGANISTAQVLAQIEILNEDFTALNEKYYETPSQWFDLAANPNIQFCLASVDPNGDPTDGIDRHNLAVTGTSWTNNNINSFIKPQTNWDPNKYFNIYVLSIPGTTAAGGVVGFSNYPSASLIGIARDGVVIDYNWFGAPGFPASGWRPLTHETGHYLGLPHPFAGNDCSLDDGIADTPNMDQSTREYMTLNCEDGFPTGPHSCGSDHLYVNYMDYVTENCYTSFTQGQVNVMRSVLDGTSSGFGYGSREELINSAPQQCALINYDAGIIRLQSPDAINCANNTLIPEVLLRNFGVEELTITDIVYSINNGPLTSYVWQGSLFPGENIIVELPPFSPPNGFYDLVVYTNDPNGMVDERSQNDSLLQTLFTNLSSPPPLVENVEQVINFPTLSGFFPFNITNDQYEWEISGDASAFGQGSKSFLFDNYEQNNSGNTIGTLDALISRHFDLSNVADAVLYFDVAYASLDNFGGDSLLVLVATDCSQNFDQLVYRKGGTELSTAPPHFQPFTPVANEWRTESVDLSAYDGNPDVTLAFVNFFGGGNRMFLDNIKLGIDCAAFSVSGSTTNETGFNQSDGTATAQVITGNPPFRYQWSNGVSETSVNFSHTIANLAPGTYSVEIEDALGCVQIQQVVVGSVCDQLSLSTPFENVSCFGGNDGSITAIPSNGTSPYEYNWSNGNTTHVANQLTAGTYMVTVTDANSCPVERTVTITSPEAILIDATATNETMANANDGTANVMVISGGSPGFTYQWSNGANAPVINNLSPGSYQVTVTDSQDCTVTASVVVQSVDCDNFTSIISWENISCSGKEDGMATATVGGATVPVTYAWSNGGNTATITNLEPGTYAVSVSDAAGCSAELEATVLEPTQLEVTVSATQVSAPGASDGTANAVVSGGIPPVPDGYDFAWSNGGTTPEITDLSAGVYSVTITDANGCTASAMTEVKEPDCALQIELGAQPASCPNIPDGTAEVLAVPGGTLPFTYNWSGGGQNALLEDLIPDTYLVTVTDANGCSVQGSVEVISEDNISPTLVLQQSLEITLDANGMAFLDPIQFDNGSFDNCSMVFLSLSQQEFNCDHVGINTLTITGTDNSNNSATGQVTVSVLDTENPLITCPDNVFVNGCDTVFYELPTGEDNCGVVELNLVAGLENGTVFPPGSTTVTWAALDGSGNEAVCSFEVNVNYDLGLMATVTNPSCQGDSDGNIELFVSGGLTPYQFLWSHGGSPNNLAAGTYTVTVLDQNGCSLEETFELSDPPKLEIEILNVEPAMGGNPYGSISLSINGGSSPFILRWMDGLGNEINGFDPQQALPGVYTLQVIDANGCTVTTGNILVDNLNSVSEEEPLAQIVLFPNPASGEFYIKSTQPAEELIEVFIYDVTGKRLINRKVRFNESIDIASLSPGIFWVKIGLAEGLTWRKLILL